MASRQEEKERRRQQRIAAEQEQARREASRQRLQWIGGGSLAVIAVAVIIGVLVVPALGGGNDKGSGKAGGADTPTVPTRGVQIPPQQNTDLLSAARAAGCTVKTFPSEGRTHSSNPADWNYKTNPPTSGTHDPTPAADGVYPFGEQPSVGMTTHALEHGRIEIQYKPGTPKATVDQLEALLAENDDGYHMLLFENTTGMKAAVAATAWTHSVTCPEMNDKVFDAFRTFRDRYIDKGPERVA
jgi:Protein of unknown function (DUF3105)